MIKYVTDQTRSARRSLRMRLASTSLLPLAMFAFPAAAQEAETSEGETLREDIVITASKQPATVLETPQAVSVVTTEELKLRGVQDLNAALSYSSGIRFRDYPGQQGMAEFFLRGFRANTGAAGVFRDGLRAQFNGLDGDIETYGVERIELLKGPSSVLYGQGSPGGLINVRSKRPTRDPVREVVLQGGSYNYLQGALDLGGAISSDGKWLYRLTALYRDADSQIDYDRNDRVYVAPAISFLPGDRTSITLMGQYFRTITGGSTQSFPASGTIFANPNGKIPRNRFLGDPQINRSMMENRSITLEVTHDFNNWLGFRQVARYAESTFDLFGIFDNNGGNLVNNRTLARGAYDRDSASDQIATDVGLSIKKKTGAIQHNLLIGLDYAHNDRTNVQFNGAIAPIDVYAPVYNVPVTFGTTPVSDSLTHNEVTGVYASEQAKLGRLTLTAAARYDWVRGRITLRNAGNRTIDINANAFTWRAGAIYETEIGVAPYFSYATSFLPIPGATFDGTPFQPTRGEQFEGGLKYEPAPGSLITASVYQITQTNVATPDQSHPGFFVQQGEVRSRGFEFEARAEVIEGLNVIAAYAYTDAETTKANPNAAGLSEVGLRQVAVAEHVASGFFSYRFPLGDNVMLTLGGGARYVSGSFNPTNTLKTEGYMLVDGVASLDFGRFTLSVNATNLFDEHYFTPGIAANSVFYGNARTILGTLRYNF